MSKTRMSKFAILHWTKKWIYIKFAQRKNIANICLLQIKAAANVVKATFATIFTLMCKYGSKCGLYHVCYSFALQETYVCNTFALWQFNVNPFFRPVLGTGEGRRPLLQEIHVIAMIMCLFQAIRDVNTLAIIQNLTLNEPWGTQE